MHLTVISQLPCHRNQCDFGSKAHNGFRQLGEAFSFDGGTGYLVYGAELRADEVLGSCPQRTLQEDVQGDEHGQAHKSR